MGGNMTNEIVYKGVTITRLFPSGMYEIYCTKEGRFLKFDDLKMVKQHIKNTHENKY